MQESSSNSEFREDKNHEMFAAYEETPSDSMNSRENQGML